MRISVGLFKFKRVSILMILTLHISPTMSATPIELETNIQATHEKLEVSPVVSDTGSTGPEVKLNSLQDEQKKEEEKRV